ncbi:MAG: DUF2491 family protein [Magnetococcales bacterium]|nr:DUF2491 family protein [Magnetococcales bacterium]
MSFRVMGAVMKSQAGKAVDRVRSVFSSDSGHASRGPADTPGPLGLVAGGMVTFTETMFILRSEESAVEYPGSNKIIGAHGTATLQGQSLHRYYLEDGRSTIQVITDRSGKPIPGELKLFQAFDEVDPATGADWDFWMSDEDGSIGLDQFQTRDGVLYDRAWSPGGGRIPPVRFTETIRPAGNSGMSSAMVRHEAMLYKRPLSDGNGAEYMLLSAVESGGGAWVEIQVGVDLDPVLLEVV